MCVDMLYIYTTDHDPGLLLLVSEGQLLELALVLELVQQTLMNIHE